MHWFLKFIFGIKFYMFRRVPLSIIRNFSLYTQQWYMSYRFADRLSANMYVLLCVQWKTPDDGQRNCPKHVEFYSKNKFEKLVHLVGFIVTMEERLHTSHPDKHTAFTSVWLSNNSVQTVAYSNRPMSALTVVSSQQCTSWHASNLNMFTLYWGPWYFKGEFIVKITSSNICAW